MTSPPRPEPVQVGLQSLRSHRSLQDPQAVLNNLQPPLQAPRAQLSDHSKPPLLHSLVAELRLPGKESYQLQPPRRSERRSTPETKVLKTFAAYLTPTKTPVLHSLD